MVLHLVQGRVQIEGWLSATTSALEPSQAIRLLNANSLPGQAGVHSTSLRPGRLFHHVSSLLTAKRAVAEIDPDFKHTLVSAHFSTAAEIGQHIAGRLESRLLVHVRNSGAIGALASGQGGHYRRTVTALHNADYLVAPSSFVARALRDVGFERVIMLANPTPDPTPCSQEPEAGCHRGGRCLLWIGRDHPVKQLDHALRAVAYLQRYYAENEQAVHLHVIGADSEPPKLAPSHVYWEGRMSRAKLASMYQRSEGVINTSSMETFGNVAAEAQMAGLPVFAYPVGALPETIFAGGVARIESPTELARELYEYCWPSHNRHAVRNEAIRRYGIESVAAGFRSFVHDSLL